MSLIQVYSSQEEQVNAAIVLFIETAMAAIDNKGFFTVALSGGSTPKKMYAGLAAPKYWARPPWEKIHLFFGDERHVPSDHSESNFRMVKETLLRKISIPEENVHRVKGELDADAAAYDYENQLHTVFNQEWPDFDLVFLGMGMDGHTASLFPNTTALNEEKRWFVSNYLPQQDVYRLTLTKNAINAARKIVVLVNGQSKAEMLSSVLQGEYNPTNKPIQLISPSEGEMIWLLDKMAANQLENY